MNDPLTGVTTTTRTTTAVPHTYIRAGYYDSDGNYVSPANAPKVPANMMPPIGMCRIWYPGRSADEQPNAQSCTGIHNVVPPGTYVIYGG